MGGISLFLMPYTAFLTEQMSCTWKEPVEEFERNLTGSFAARFIQNKNHSIHGRSEKREANRAIV